MNVFREFFTSNVKRFLKTEEGLELSEHAVASALMALACLLAFTDLGAAIGARS